MIWTAVKTFLTGSWQKLLLIGGVVLSVALVLLRARNAGKESERIAQMERNARARSTRRKKEREIYTSDGPTAVERLRERWSRD